MPCLPSPGLALPNRLRGVVPGAESSPGIGERCHALEPVGSPHASGERCAHESKSRTRGPLPCELGPGSTRRWPCGVPLDEVGPSSSPSFECTYQEMTLVIPSFYTNHATVSSPPIYPLLRRDEVMQSCGCRRSPTEEFRIHTWAAAHASSHFHVVLLFPLRNSDSFDVGQSWSCLLSFSRFS